MIGQRKQQIAEVATLHRVLNEGLIDQFDLAIDAGAHVGTWTAVLAGAFRRVVAFEPNPTTFQQLVANTAHLPGVELRLEAVMNRPGTVRVFPPKPNKTSAGWQVEFEAGAAGQAVALDDFGFKQCGLIKLDLEGAELHALHGAFRTIRRSKPALIVELGGLSARFGHQISDIYSYIIGLGYREAFRAGVDHVFVRK